MKAAHIFFLITFIGLLSYGQILIEDDMANSTTQQSPSYISGYIFTFIKNILIFLVKFKRAMFGPAYLVKNYTPPAAHNVKKVDDNPKQPDTKFSESVIYISSSKAQFSTSFNSKSTTFSQYSTIINPPIFTDTKIKHDFSKSIDSSFSKSLMFSESTFSNPPTTNSEEFSKSDIFSQSHSSSAFTKSTVFSQSHSSSEFSQPIPSKSIEPTFITESEPIDEDVYNQKLMKINDKIEKIIKENDDSPSYSDFQNIIMNHESEAEIYCSKIIYGYQFQEAKRCIGKFKNILPIIPVPKSSNMMWTAPIAKNAQFEFSSTSDFPIVNKIAFDIVPLHSCILKSFYIKLIGPNNVEMSSPIFTLNRGSNTRQNFSLPFPIKFKLLYIVAVNNYGNTSHTCLPDFRVFESVGFHS